MSGVRNNAGCASSGYRSRACGAWITGPARRLLHRLTAPSGRSMTGVIGSARAESGVSRRTSAPRSLRARRPSTGRSGPGECALTRGLAQLSARTIRFVVTRRSRRSAEPASRRRSLSTPPTSSPRGPGPSGRAGAPEARHPPVGSSARALMPRPLLRTISGVPSPGERAGETAIGHEPHHGDRRVDRVGDPGAHER
jgi:hypothetical protein